MKILILLTALLVPSMGLAQPGAEAGARADVVGRVTQLRQTGGGERVVVMFVEGPQGGDANYDKASVTVTKRTRIFRQRGRARRRVGVGALEAGREVEVRFTGPVLKSYPVQATAEEVVILD